MTQFAVATVKQAKYLMGVHALSDVVTSASMGDSPYLAKGWTESTPRGVRLTDTGRLAMRLRFALGPDRSLTRAGAKGLLKGGATRATRLRLMQDGLWHRSYMLGVPDAWLTEDGLKVREILRKYRAEL